jgi:hypothetical protein
LEGKNSITSWQTGLAQVSCYSYPHLCNDFFFILNSCCKELDKTFKKIWWGFPSKKTRNLSLKAWDSICTPKALGGLGIRKMREVNLALISKLGWQLLNNSDTLWVSQLQGKYLNSSSFLSPSPFFFLLAMERRPEIPILHHKRSLFQNS